MLVDEDPVIDRDPGARGEIGARLRADADDDEIAFELATVAGANPLHRCRSFERLDGCAEQHLHAVVGVDVAVDPADLVAEHALQRDTQRIEHGHLEAPLSRRSGDLGADPPGADDDDVAAAVQPLAQRVGVLDAAQIQDPVKFAAGDLETSRLSACGKQQPVVVQPFAVVER